MEEENNEKKNKKNLLAGHRTGICVGVCVCVNVRARECVQFFISAAKRTVTVRGGKKRRKIKRLKAKR